MNDERKKKTVQKREIGAVSPLAGRKKEELINETSFDAALTKKGKKRMIRKMTSLL